MTDGFSTNQGIKLFPNSNNFNTQNVNSNMNTNTNIGFNNIEK